MLLFLSRPSKAPKPVLSESLQQPTLDNSNPYYKLNVCFSGQATLQMEIFTSHLKNLLAGGRNDYLGCSVFGPGLLKSPQVNFAGMSKDLMITVSLVEVVIGAMEQKNSFHVLLSLKVPAWPKPCLDDSLISAFGSCQSLACWVF